MQETEFDVADFSDLKSWQQPKSRQETNSKASRSVVRDAANKSSKTNRNSEGAVRRLNPKMINSHNSHKFRPKDVIAQYQGPETERLSNLKSKLHSLKNPRMTLKTMSSVKTPYVIISEH